MMGTTHALTGLLIGASAMQVFPEYFPVAALACMIGSVLPDIDMPLDHRKTTHFTEHFTLIALLSAVLVLASPSLYTVILFYIAFGAAVHCWMDAFGGGLEFKPWEENSDKGVYLHIKQDWIKPRRWIRYDGAPEDLLLAVMIAIPISLIYTGLIQQLIYLLVAISAVYTVLRKQFPKLELFLKNFAVFDRYWRR